MKIKLLPLFVLLGVMALFVLGFCAELYDGTVSNLIAPLYEAARTNMNGAIGVPVNASTYEDGYSLTADAIIRDDESVAIVYTFAREDGQPIPPKVSFERYDGGELEVIYTEDDPHQVKLVTTTPYEGTPIGRIKTVSFSGLHIEGKNDEVETVLADGPWELTFVHRYKNSSVSTDKEITVHGEDGTEYIVKRIELSPLTLHLDITTTAPNTADGRSMFDGFTVALRMKDGTLLSLHSGSSSGTWEGDGGNAQAEYEREFKLPVFLSDIEVLVICDSKIDIDDFNV